MDEGFEQQIKNALSDPDIMQKVSGVLSSLSGGEKSNEEKTSVSLMPNDDRTKLLLALKPFLSEKRAGYMDSAVNILRLASLGKIGKDLKLF
jgi:hypothetical protein